MSLVRALARVAGRAADGARSRLAFGGASRVGDGVRLFGWPRVSCEGTLVIGRDVVFVSSPAPIELLVARGATLVIGDGTLVESGATLRAGHSVVIGRRARIGAGCVVDDDGAEPGITVADEAWIEDGAVLLGGASVAGGQVVPRGAIVGDRAGGVEVAVEAATADDEVAGAARDRVEERVRAVMARVVPAAATAEWAADLRLSKGWDSLAALRVLVALEKEFGVSLPYDLFTQQPRLASVAPYVLGRDARPRHAP
jgi:acyl carrier protein/acetyltransferase-like isoleucine patch superfamily enzyme